MIYRNQGGRYTPIDHSVQHQKITFNAVDRTSNSQGFPQAAMKPTPGLAYSQGPQIVKTNDVPVVKYVSSDYEKTNEFNHQQQAKANGDYASHSNEAKPKTGVCTPSTMIIAGLILLLVGGAVAGSLFYLKSRSTTKQIQPTQENKIQTINPNLQDGKQQGAQINTINLQGSTTTATSASKNDQNTVPSSSLRVDSGSATPEIGVIPTSTTTTGSVSPIVTAPIEAPIITAPTVNQPNLKPENGLQIDYLPQPSSAATIPATITTVSAQSSPSSVPASSNMPIGTVAPISVAPIPVIAVTPTTTEANIQSKTVTSSSSISSSENGQTISFQTIPATITPTSSANGTASAPTTTTTTTTTSGSSSKQVKPATTGASTVSVTTSPQTTATGSSSTTPTTSVTATTTSPAISATTTVSSTGAQLSSTTGAAAQEQAQEQEQEQEQEQDDSAQDDDTNGEQDNSQQTTTVGTTSVTQQSAPSTTATLSTDATKPIDTTITTQTKAPVATTTATLSSPASTSTTTTTTDH